MFGGPAKDKVEVKIDLFKADDDVKTDGKLPMSMFTANRSAPPSMPTGEKPKQKSLFDPVNVSNEKKSLFGTPPPSEKTEKKQETPELAAPVGIPSLKKNVSIFNS